MREKADNKMKILFVCQHYDPEPFRHPDICEELVRQGGHEVTVVTGLPNYPMGEIYDGYRKGEKRDEILNGVTVHRCFTIGRKHNVVCRFLNYYSYVLSSMRYVKKLAGDYDVVYVHQLSPVMMAYAAMQYKKEHGTPVLLYCLDLWPDSLVAGGIARGSMLYKIFHRISENIYRQADRILVGSQSFVEYFVREFKMTGIEYLPQYAESIFTPEQCRKTENGYIDLMFAGNIGTAQSVDTIIGAAKLTADIPNLRWHIVGDGVELERLRVMAAGMEQVIFHGRRPLKEMPDYYAMADAMLVTMRKDPVLSLTLPGKVQTYMAAGKPIIGAIDGETTLVIETAGCGLCSGAEDAEALAENVRRFVGMDKRMLGQHARAYYDTHFEKQVFLYRLERALALCAASGDPKNEVVGAQ